MNCVIALDATLAGRPCSALPSGYLRLRKLLEFYSKSLQRPVSLQRMAGKAAIDSAMRRAGPGARGIVLGAHTLGGPAHVWHVANEKYLIVYRDGQSGVIFQNWLAYDEFYLLRTN